MAATSQRHIAVSCNMQVWAIQAVLSTKHVSSVYRLALGLFIARRPQWNTASNAKTNSRGVMLPLEPATAPIISETLTMDVKVMTMGPIQDVQKRRRKNSLASACSPTTRSDEKSELSARDVVSNEADSAQMLNAITSAHLIHLQMNLILRRHENGEQRASLRKQNSNKEGRTHSSFLRESLRSHVRG